MQPSTHSSLQTSWMFRLWQVVEQDFVHSLYCIPIGHLGTVHTQSNHFMNVHRLTVSLCDRHTYSTDSPPASRVKPSHERGRCGRTPAALDSSSPQRRPRHSDTPPPDTATGTPPETPGGRSAGTRWRSATRYSWRGSTNKNTASLKN